MAPVPLWLDCDPGHDDAFAILLAAYHHNIQLLGISTVFGNASLEKTTPNASSILTAIGKHNEITIYPGYANPLHRAPMHDPASSIHGESGLDGTNLLPEGLATINRQISAIDAMYNALIATPKGTAYLVATGPQTNAAALFEKYPDLAEHMAGFSLMGGAVGDGFTKAILGEVDGKERIGNWSPYAEFNILVDPEAAASLFLNPVLAEKTTLIPLDLTHQVLATDEIQKTLLYGKESPAARVIPGKGKTILRTMLVELLLFFAETYADIFGITDGPPLHDPLAVAIALIGTDDEIPFYDYRPNDSSKTPERFRVTVVTDGSYEDAKDGVAQTGRTIVEPLPSGVSGVRIPRGLDIEKFWAEIATCIDRADAANAQLTPSTLNAAAAASATTAAGKTAAAVAA
ncbi:Uridine nucleosidase [Ceratocystis fimbriata CBS 114723]|uniref:Uridine nucleosidase n=1 Tax=Ceratocystis fimbriata CBS 114723 TaxID=1035309 RepID=A0A2C5WBX3_9PEZI|nr:Uridine nucleosidase [Ceratocystis fimbriata CBS 114723]